MKDVRVRPCIAQGDLDSNMDIIMRRFAKTAFLFPDADSIRKYDAATSYNWRGNTAAPVAVGASAVITPTKSASTTDYTITLTGEVAKLATASKTAIFASGNETHATVLLIEVPTKDISKLVVKFGSTEQTLNAADVIEIDNRFYFVHILGIYDSTGTITTATTAITITCGLHTVKYAVAVNTATLAA